MLDDILTAGRALAGDFLDFAHGEIFFVESVFDTSFVLSAGLAFVPRAVAVDASF